MKKFALSLLVLFCTLMLAFANGSDESSQVGHLSKESFEDANPFGSYDPPITVTYAVKSNAALDFPEGDSYEENIWTRSLSRDLGLSTEVAWQAPGENQNYETKVNLAIASNDVPDILTLENYSQFERLVQAGKISDLTEIFEAYASPQLKKHLMSDGGISMGWATIDGKLMGIPVESINFSTTRMVYIRRDWFEASGLSEPETMEDVIEIARAFKAADPDNRHGLAFMKQVLRDGFCDMTGIANSLGAYPQMWIEDEKGSLIYGSIQPEMKEAIALYAEFYKEGLIDPEFAVKNGGQVGQQITSGQIGVIVGNFWLPSWPLSSLFKTDDVEWNIYPLMPMKDPNAEIKVQTDVPLGKMHVVRKGYENPEALIKIMNYQVKMMNESPNQYHSDDNFKYHMMVPVYPIASDIRENFNTNYNVTKAIEGKDTSYLVSAHDKMQYERVKAYFDAVDNGMKPEQGDWVAFNFFFGPGSTFGIQNHYFEEDMYLTSKLVGYETPEMSRKKITLQNLEETMISQIIVGSKPIEYFDEFVETWRSLGGELIEYEVNEWWKNR